MGCLIDDLDRFLRTEGIRIVAGSGGVRAGGVPLSEDDIDGLGSMDLEGMDRADLEDLLDRAENLRDDLEDLPPEEESSEEYALWDSRLFRLENFIDRVQERLDDPGEKEKE